MEKLLNVQELERCSKDGFIKILKTSYMNKVENNLTHIKESSDSKLGLFSTLYDNSNMPCYLNMDFSKVKRSLIAKLRLSCHSLNIETMRYCRPKVVRHQRFCPFCPDAVESEEHFLLHRKKYDSLRKNSKFISETMHDLGIGADTVKHILNPQTKQNCKSVAHFIDDALHVRKSSINK